MKNSLGYKIGLAEIIGIVVGIIGYMLLELFANQNGIAMQISGDCIRCVWVSLLAGSLGPLVGGVVGFIGAQIQCNLSGQSFAVIISIGMALYGFIIGIYAKRMRVREGWFVKESVKVLEGIQAISAVFCFVLVKPLLIFIISESNLFGLISYGCKCALTVAIVVGVFDLLVFKAITFLVKGLNNRKASVK